MNHRRRHATVTALAAGALILGAAPAAPTPGAPPKATPSSTNLADALPAPQPGATAYGRPADGDYDIVGGGFGHGIGMSQYGAQGAALQGLTHAQILAFYYKGTSLVAQAPGSIDVGITIDNDGILRISARPGLSVRVGGVTTALPTTPTQWRVRATGSTASTCVVESLTGSTWTVWHSGATACPVSFSSTEDTVDVILPTSERRIYRGTVTAHHKGTTNLGTVNTLSMQYYLRGVVPSEMPPSWHAQALASQAVAARTFAARRSNSTSWYDTCDTTACQVYKGRGKRNADGTITSFEYASTDAAIDATNGKVLTFPFSDGVTRLATTMYSSSNGGWAAASGNGHDYLWTHSDSYDAVSVNPRHRWSATLPVTSLESRFGIHRVERVQILERDGDGLWGGRVLRARVEGFTSGGTYVYKDTTGNGIMGARPWPTNSTGLSSNYFTIRPAGTVSRLGTGDVYSVAAGIATASYPVGVPVVYVTNGGASSESLVASARAAYNGGPLLYTASTSIPASTRDAMARLKPGRVVVVGGSSTVSSAVATSLRSMTTSGQMERVYGSTRYATAAKLSSSWPAGTAVAYVAAGDSWGDALSGAALAGRDRAPILLTAKGTLPAETVTELRRLRPARIVVIGGTGSISSTVAKSLASYATTRSVTRVGGADRYASSALVGARYASATRVLVSPGASFQQATAAAALAGKLKIPVLLTTASSLPDAVRVQVERLRPGTVNVTGDQSVVSTTVLRQLANAVS